MDIKDIEINNIITNDTDKCISSNLFDFGYNNCIVTNPIFNHINDIKWEIVSEFENEIDSSYLPKRATKESAGFDLKAARDVVVPSIFSLKRELDNNIDQICNTVGNSPYTLNEADSILKEYGARATIVPTGLKCKMPYTLRCGLYSRSSMPYKHLLMVANGVGIIDSDYYNNKGNEGHIGVMLINLSPFDILIKKGDKIAQAIFEPYMIGHIDMVENEIRVGGYGSTGK